MDRPVVEVSQWWGDELLDVRVFGPDESVTIGSRSARRWRFLGVDMGFVTAPLGALLGLVPFGWSDVEAERRADFVVPDLEDDHVLVAHVAGSFTVVAPSGWLRHEADEVVTIASGLFRFVVRRATADRVSQRFLVDVHSVAVGSSVAAAMLGVGLLAAAAPRAEALVRVDRAIPMEVMLRAPPPVIPQKPGPKSGAATKGREGPKPKADKPKIGRPRTDREVATSGGLFGADFELSSSLPASLVTGVGGLIGTNGHGPGGHGLGTRGGGLGGGGAAEGLGGFGDVGRGFGAGPGGDGFGKVEGAIHTTNEEIRTVGPIDPRQIDEVVKRHLNSIRYCYQRELQRQPGLAGKVSMKFTIAADGTVSAARATGTLEHEAVRGCLVGKFLGMQFPRPRGGGIVVVSYPFLFAAQ